MAIPVYPYLAAEPWRPLSALLLGTTPPRPRTIYAQTPDGVTHPRTVLDQPLPATWGAELPQLPLPPSLDAFHGWLERTRGDASTGTRYFPRSTSEKLWQAASAPRRLLFAYQRRTDPTSVVLGDSFVASLLEANPRWIADAAKWRQWWRTYLCVGDMTTTPAGSSARRRYWPIVPARALLDGVTEQIRPVTPAELATFYPSETRVRRAMS